jgi:hypothetical protein
MAYLVPSEFVTKMVDAGEIQNLHVDTRYGHPRLYGRGPSSRSPRRSRSVSISTGVPIVGAALFPVGFCMLYLFGFDLLTGACSFWRRWP